MIVEIQDENGNPHTEHLCGAYEAKIQPDTGGRGVYTRW